MRPRSKSKVIFRTFHPSPLTPKKSAERWAKCLSDFLCANEVTVTSRDWQLVLVYCRCVTSTSIVKDVDTATQWWRHLVTGVRMRTQTSHTLHSHACYAPPGQCRFQHSQREVEISQRKRATWRYTSQYLETSLRINNIHCLSTLATKRTPVSRFDLESSWLSVKKLFITI